MNVDIILIRLVQFVIFVLFAFMMLVFVGTLLLLPLDIIYHIVRLLHAIGLPMVIALVMAGGALFYIGRRFWGMASLCKTIVDIGTQLLAFSREQVKRFDVVLAEYRHKD